MTKHDNSADFFDGIEHAPEHLLLDWITRIQSGERGKHIDGMARRVIQDYCLRQWMRSPHSPVVLDWFASVLSDVLEHQDAAKLLGLEPRKKGKPATGAEISMEVAFWLRITESRGYAPAEAVQLAADTFFRDAKTIERDRRIAKEWADGMNMDVDWEERFLIRRRPLPPSRSD